MGKVGQFGKLGKLIERIDDLSISRNKIIINSTQKVSSRVLNSRNMMSVGGTSYLLPW